MGQVYIGQYVVGSFEPQLVGASGTVWMDITQIGTFSFPTASGTVYIDSMEVGTYSGLAPVPPTTGQINPSIINPRVFQS
jgi:hypothetical protein